MDKSPKIETAKYFIDEMDKRTNLFLKISLILVTLLFLGLLLVSIFTNVQQIEATKWVYLTIMLISVILYILLIYGYKRFSSYVLVFLTWAGMLFFVWKSRGIYDVANLGILVVILFSALLVNRRFALIVSIISLIHYWFIVYLTTKGYFVPSIAPPLNMARDYTGIMIATVALVFFYETTMHKSLYKITELLLKNDKDQELLKNTEHSYLEIFESIDDAILIHDIDTGNIVDSNLSALGMFGYQKSEFTKISIEDLSAVENGFDSAKVKEKLREAREKGHLSFEWQSKRANGNIFYSSVHLKNSVINGRQRILAVIRDISDELIALEKLRFNEEQYRTLVTNIPGAVYRCQVHVPWKTMYFSEEIYNISGYTASEFMEREVVFGDLMHPDDLPMVESVVENSILEKTKFNLEYRFYHKDGTLRWALEKGQVKFSDNGQPLWLDGVILDITERIQAENEVKMLNENLERIVSERTNQLMLANQDLEAFTYSVSHDLRAPLRHIDGFAKILFSNVREPSDNIVTYYNKINQATKRMTNMIDDLLGFSKLGRKEIMLTPVNISITVSEIIDQFKPDIISRDIEWVIGELPTILADRGLIRIVFENLISNAIKYTSKVKTARIELGYKELENNKVDIFVKDNGAGFDMVYAKKLFGVFHRLHTSEEFEGTGIGLANVKQIMLKHNGEIRAEGKVNNGAIFFVTLSKI
jgi:PAS domain S-box-containing protein